MATDEQNKPKVVFGSRRFAENGTQAQNLQPAKQVTPITDSQPQDGMPVWDEPPMETYQNDSSYTPDDNWEHSSPEEFGIPSEFEENQPSAPVNQSTVSLVPEGQMEIYAYPRSVKVFNQSVKFGLGIDYEFAKRVQQEEIAKRRNSQPMNNNTPQQQPQSNRTPTASSPTPERNATGGNRSSYQAQDNTQAQAQTQTPPPAPNGRGQASNISNNLAYLDSTPLLIIMEHFANYSNDYSKSMTLKHLYQNVFQMGDYKIRVNNEEGKWYNIDTRRGNTNALSLARELIAIHDDMNLSDTAIFKIACSKATKEVNTIQRNIERYTNLDELVALTKASNDNKNKKAATKETYSGEYMDKQYNGDTEANNVANTQKQTNSNMSSEAWAAMRDHLNSIPLRQIAEWLGATPGEDGNPNLWKFHSLSGNNIAITGQSFKNWNYSGNGGKGAINFMKQYISIAENIPESEDEVLYKKAFNALMKEFGNKEGLYVLDGEEYQTAFCFPHILPGKTNEVKYYLNGERGLPMWIINKQISNGVLFAGFPSDWEPDKLLRESEKMRNDRVWATFLAPNGMAAEMRGIGNNKPAKILAKGSEKNTGGYLVPAEKKYNEGILAICEASVDATSYSSLYPGRSSTSVMGVNVDLAIELTFEADEKGLKAHINFDNDFAGNSATYQYDKKLQEQIDDDENASIYNEYLNSGKIKYFELGIQIFKESLKKGIPYYFDMHSKPEGIEASNLFLQTLMREMDREDIKKYLSKGKLKVNNVCPAWAEIKDIDLEAKAAVEHLKKSPRYYYYAEPIKEFEPNPHGRKEHEELRLQNHKLTIEKREAFIQAFEKYAGPENLILWKMDKRIAENIEPLAKDWNEWMKYQLENNKELKKEFEQREIEFKHYEQDVKKMKPSDLGNSEKIKKVRP